MSSTADESLKPVGLCGPSELRVPRRRVEAPPEATPAAAAPTLHDDVGREGSDAGAAGQLGGVDGIRERVLGSISERLEALDKVCGRQRIADLVCAFLGTSGSAADLMQTRSKRRGLMHATTRSKNLDFFFKVVPKLAPSHSATEHLRTVVRSAWQEDPEVCVKLVFQLGAAKKGKQDRYNFYDAILQLWDLSPAAVISNLKSVPKIVYWKAVLEIVARVCEGQALSTERDVVMYQAFVHQRPKLLAEDASAPPVDADAPGWRYTYCKNAEEGQVGLRVACGEAVKVPEQQGWVVSSIENGQDPNVRKRGTCGWQPRNRLQQAELAVTRYDRDPLYRALHLEAARLFAEQLALDEELLKKKQEDPQAKGRISIAAKWAPLLDKSFDRRTLIAESIARMLYPPQLPEFEGLSEQHYSYRARLKYSKLLTALKEYRKEPMTLVNAKRFKEIKYSAVPASAMRILAPKFTKFDRKRFLEYLDATKIAKKSKMHFGSLQPHQLLRTMAEGKPAEKDVAELQWKGMVENLKKNSEWKRCMAFCDVGYSMQEPVAMDIPYKAKGGNLRLFDELPPRRGELNCLDVAISLSLIVSEVADPPFRNRVMTFERNAAPTMLRAGCTLNTKRTELVKKYDEAVQKCPKDHSGRALKHTIASNAFAAFQALVEAKDLPERIFIFSAMQWNRPTIVGGKTPGVIRGEDGKELTVFEAAQQLFRQRKRPWPQVICWNLSGCHGSPVVCTQAGVMLVSGFSAALVKDVLTSGSLDPLGLMQKALSSPVYEPIAVPTTETVAALVESTLKLQSPAHSFEVGEEWEMVCPEVVEANEVEAKVPAKPKRKPLLAVRGVRRVNCGDMDANEDALLALIGVKGQVVKAARALLSVTAANRLNCHARVWLDVEFVGDRLGALAVTLSARVEEAQLRKELDLWLLPAADALLRRASRPAAEAKRRKDARVSGEWLEKKLAAKPRPKRDPYDHYDTYWYEEDYEPRAPTTSYNLEFTGAGYSATANKRSPPKPPQAPVFFMQPSDVEETLAEVPAIVDDETVKSAFEDARHDRRHSTEWPAPRCSYNPDPPKQKHWEESAGQYYSKVFLRLQSRKRQKDAEERVNRAWTADWLQKKAEKVFADKETEHARTAPRGGPHGSASPASNKANSKLYWSRSAQRSHQQQVEKEAGEERRERLRDVRRTQARDAKSDGSP